MTAFLRMGEPVIVPVAAAAQSVSAPVPMTANAIRAYNPNKFDVRFRGGDTPDDLVTSSTGIRLAAGATECFSTQTPGKPYLTAMSVDSLLTGTAAGNGVLEVQFGTGE